MLRNLAHKAFEQPICEALLDQRFFNGIGNYLRAEILHRSAGRPRGWGVCPRARCLAGPLSARCSLGIPPFEKARTVLEALQQRRPVRARDAGPVGCGLQCGSRRLLWASGPLPCVHTVGG